MKVITGGVHRSMHTSGMDGLLPPHGDHHVGFTIRDQLAGQIHRDTLDGPGEFERIAIVIRRRRSPPS